MLEPTVTLTRTQVLSPCSGPGPLLVHAARAMTDADSRIASLQLQQLLQALLSLVRRPFPPPNDAKN